MSLTIRKVSKDELPKSNVPGRQRQPSDFDSIMEEAFNDGEWREVVYDGTVENLNYLLGELNRAAVFCDYGKSVRGVISKDEETGETDDPVRNDDGDAVFFFQIRTKLKTGRRGPRKDADGNPIAGTDGEGEPVEVDTNGTGTGDDDAGLSEIATSIEDAKSSKRGRGGKRVDAAVTTDVGSFS